MISILLIIPQKYPGYALPKNIYGNCIKRARRTLKALGLPADPRKADEK